jgi:hypothetical protein
MMKSIRSRVEELSVLLDDDGLFGCPRLHYVKPAILTRKAEPSDESLFDETSTEPSTESPSDVPKGKGATP